MTEREKHPSQVQVSFSRVQSSHPIPFYGSDIKVNNWIQLRIKTSVKRRDLSNDYFCADDTLLEIRLSPNQFSELLTTMNVGEGVPGTLTFHQNLDLPNGVVPMPAQENKTTIFKEEINLLGTDIMARMIELENTVTDLNITKTAKNAILERIRMVKQDITSNLPFILQQAKEQVDKIVTAGKSAVDAFYTGIITRLGIAALQNQPRITLIENDDKNE
jgi:hypothetical protein